MTDLVVPDIGAGGLDVRLGRWLVDDGEQVREHESVVELIVPGAVIDVSAPVSGTLIERRLRSGTIVVVGDVLGAIEEVDGHAEFDAVDASGTD